MTTADSETGGPPKNTGLFFSVWRACLISEIDAVHRHALCVIADMIGSDPHGEAWPGTPYLAHRIGVSERHLPRLLAAIEAGVPGAPYRLVRRDPRRDPRPWDRDPNRRGQSSRYMLVPLPSCHPCHPVTPDTMTGEGCHHVTPTPDRMAPPTPDRMAPKSLITLSIDPPMRSSREREGAAPPTPPPPPKGPSVGIRERASGRGTRLPADWTPSEADRTYAREHGIQGTALETEAERFRNHWLSQAGPKGSKADWAATWRNWILRAAEYAEEHPAPIGPIIGYPTEDERRNRDERERRCKAEPECKLPSGPRTDLLEQAAKLRPMPGVGTPMAGLVAARLARFGGPGGATGARNASEAPGASTPKAR